MPPSSGLRGHTAPTDFRSRRYRQWPSKHGDNPWYTSLLLFTFHLFFLSSYEVYDTLRLLGIILDSGHASFSERNRTPRTYNFRDPSRYGVWVREHLTFPNAENSPSLISE